jgi:hypothetical protein
VVRAPGRQPPLGISASTQLAPARGRGELPTWRARLGRDRATLGSAEVQLGLAALTIGLLFGVVLLAPMPLWSGQPVGPPPPGSPLSAAIGWPGWVVTVTFVAALCLPFRPYAHALRLAEHISRPTVLLGLSAGLALVALLIYPHYGSDIFDYLGFERTWVVYGENPLVALPASHPSDWATALVWYPDQSPAYGPLWAILTWPIARLAGDSALVAVLGYKVLSLAAYAACCGLVWQLVERPRRQRALVLFAWSPLVLFEILGKVHNDVLVALGALSAVWALQRAEQLWRACELRCADGLRRSAARRASDHGPMLVLVAAALVVVAASLVKLSALALLPVFGVRLWRGGGWRALGATLLGGAGLAGLAYAPFWAGWSALEPLLHQTGRQVWSVGTLLIILSSHLASLSTADVVPGVHLLLGAVWLLACALILHRARLDTTADIATTACALVLSSLLLTTAVFGHYLVPAIALAALSHDHRLELLVFWLSIGALAAYGVELLSLALGPDWIGSVGYQLSGSLVLLVPAGLALGLSLVSAARARPAVA